MWGIILFFLHVYLHPETHFQIKTHNISRNTETVISWIIIVEGEVVSIYNSIIFLKLELCVYIDIVY